VNVEVFAFGEVAEIGDNIIDAQHVICREHDACVHDESVIAQLEHGHVFADFPQSAQGNNSQFWFCHKRKLPARMTITRQVSLSV
jgi:hypothetical protein